MLRLHIARVTRQHVFNDQPNGTSVDWILYNEGEYSAPMAVLSDHDIDRLLEQVREQRAAVPSTRSTPVGRPRSSGK